MIWKFLFHTLQIHHPHKTQLCVCVCARYSEKVLSGRLCWKISEKSFFSEPFPLRKTILSKRCDGKSKPTLKMYTQAATPTSISQISVGQPCFVVARQLLFKIMLSRAFYDDVPFSSSVLGWTTKSEWDEWKQKGFSTTQTSCKKFN